MSILHCSIHDGPEESCFILHWVLGGRGMSSTGSWCGPSYTGSWIIMVRLALAPEESWSILYATWSWGVVVQSAPGPAGGSWSVLHWLLGSHGPSYTGLWGVMVCPALGVVVRPILGPGESWFVLHWVLGSRGPSSTGS